MELTLAVWKPSWSSEGHLGAQIGSDSAASADCTRQNGGQEASKRPEWEGRGWGDYGKRSHALDVF